jgi:predicted CoA-binding protein
MKSSVETPIYSSIADLPQQVDIIDVFRAPPHLPAIVEAAIAAKAKAVWMQPGTENPDAADSAIAAGLSAIVGNCIYREHKALFGIEDDRGHAH